MIDHNLQILKDGNKYTIVNRTSSSFFVESIEDEQLGRKITINRKIKPTEVIAFNYKKLALQLQDNTCNPYEPQEDDYFLYNRPGNYLLTIVNDGNVNLSNISVDDQIISSLDINQSMTLLIPYTTLQNEIQFTASTQFEDETVSDTFSLLTREATPQNHSLSSEVDTLLLSGQTSVFYKAIINAENSNVDLMITYQFTNSLVSFTALKGEITEQIFEIDASPGLMTINRKVSYTDPLCQQYISEDAEEITFRQAQNINMEILTNNSCSTQTFWTIELKQNEQILASFTTDVNNCSTTFDNNVLDPQNTYILCLKNVPTEFESHWSLNDQVINPESDGQNLCFSVHNFTDSLNFVINNDYEPLIILSKTTEVNGIELIGDRYVLVGKDVSWKYTVSNHSIHKDVTIVNIDDDQEGTIVIGQLLEKGQSITLSAGPKSAISGTYMNTATAQFTYGNISATTNSASSSYFGAEPSLTVSIALKDCFDESYIPSLDEIFLYDRPGTYLITVTNTGNVPLNDISISNDTDNKSIINLNVGSFQLLEFTYDTLVNSITFIASTTFIDSEILAQATLTTIEATPQNCVLSSQINTVLPPTPMPVIYQAIIDNTTVNVDLTVNYSYDSSISSISAAKETITKDNIQLTNLSAGSITLNRTIAYTDPLCQTYMREDNEEITFRQGSSFSLEVLTNGACSTTVIWTIELFEEEDTLLSTNSTDQDCEINFENIVLDPELTYKLVQKNVPTDYASIWRKNGTVFNPIRVGDDLQLSFTTSSDLFQKLLKNGDNNLDININNKQYSNLSLTFKNFVGISQNNFINFAGALKYRDQILYTNKNNSNIAIEPIFNTQVVNDNIS